MRSTRRQFLALSATTLAIAGCSEESDNSGGDGDDGNEAENVADWQRIDGEILSSSFPMELTEPGTGERLSEIHWHSDWAHWHKMPLEVPLDGFRSVEMRVLDRDLEPIPIGDDERYHVEVGRTEGTPADLVEIIVSDELLDIRGNTEGTGELVFQLVTEGDVVWTTPALMIEVSEEF